MLALNDLLDLPPDSRPLDLARAVEGAEVMLQYQAKRGNQEAGRAMLRLRLAYLNWAYVLRGQSSALPRHVDG